MRSFLRLAGHATWSVKLIETVLATVMQTEY